MIAAAVLCSLNAQAQTDRREVRGGNRDYKKADYAAAEIDYKKALVKDSTSVAAQYNLANTLYKIENWQEAEKYAGKALDSLSRSPRAADAFYNSGDIYLQQRRWSEAIEAFKESLRRNPGDMDAKSNLAYAQKMLQNEQQQQQNRQDNQNQDQNNQDQNNQDQNNQDQNRDNKDNQDQDQNKDRDNKDNQDSDQNKDKNRDQNQNNPDQNQDNNDNQNQDGQQPKITPEAASQMLQAIQEKENETQDKVNKEKAAALKSRQKEKNW